MFTTILSLIVTFFKLIYPFRNDIISFAKKIYLFNTDKSEFNKIQKLNSNQTKLLKGKNVDSWNRRDGQTTVKLIKVLFALEHKSNYTIILKNKTLKDGKDKIKLLESIINNTPSINKDNYIFNSDSIKNKINNNILIISSIRSKQPNYINDVMFIDDSL